MNGFRALTQGFGSSLRAIKIVLWMYSVNFLIAALVASALRNVLLRAIGNSMAFDSLLHDFDYTTYADFLNHHGDGVKALFAQFAWGGALMLLLNTLLGGGMIAALGSDERMSFREFLDACGRYLGRFFRLFLFSGFIVGFLVFVTLLILGILYSSVDASADSEKTVAINVLGGAILLSLPIILALMITDYARVLIVERDHRKMLRAYWEAIRIVFGNFFSAWAVQLSVAICTILCIVLYWMLDGSIGAASGGTIMIVFVIQQIFIAFRLWLRLWSQGSVLSLVRIVSSVELKTMPEEAPAPLPHPEIVQPSMPAVSAVEEVERKFAKPRRVRVAAKRVASKSRPPRKRRSRAR